MKRDGATKICLMVLALVASAKGIAKECEKNILQNQVAVISAAMNQISQDFVIPKTHAIGFEIRDRVTPTREQSARIYKIMKQTGSSHETMLEVFNSIAKLYDTHRVEDILHILETALQSNLQPVQLAAALGVIQRELPLIRKQLGFAEETKTFEYSEAKIHEAMVIFHLVVDRKAFDAATFRAEVDLIARELEVHHALDVLAVMEAAREFGSSLESTIEEIRAIRESLYVEQRAMGFSPNGTNYNTVRPDIHTAVALLSVMKQANLTLDKVVEGFEQYKALQKNPSVDEYIFAIVGKVERALEAHRQAMLRKQIETAKNN